MCLVNVYDKLHATRFGFFSGGYVILIQEGSTTDAMKSIYNNSNCIYVWLQIF